MRSANKKWSHKPHTAHQLQLIQDFITKHGVQKIPMQMEPFPEAKPKPTIKPKTREELHAIKQKAQATLARNEQLLHKQIRKEAKAMKAAMRAQRKKVSKKL